MTMSVIAWAIMSVPKNLRAANPHGKSPQNSQTEEQSGPGLGTCTVRAGRRLLIAINDSY